MKAVLRGCVPTWSPTLFSETHHLDSSSEYEAMQLGFQAYVSPIFHSPSPFLSLSSEHAKHIYYPTHLLASSALIQLKILALGMIIVVPRWVYLLNFYWSISYILQWSRMFSEWIFRSWIYPYSQHWEQETECDQLPRSPHHSLPPLPVWRHTPQCINPVYC